MSSEGAGAVTGEQNQLSGLVPTLRFPEFRGAGAWLPKTINDIATLYKGKGISKSDIAVDGNQFCIRYGELYTTYGEVIEEVFSKTNLPATELFFSQKNDVIIPSSGETKIDIATASCVLNNDVALGGDLNVIRPRENGTFLSYYLNGPLKFGLAKVAQGDSVVHLYPTQIGLLKLAIPNKSEQKKIADCLSSIDALIAAEAGKLDTMKEHKRGLIQQLFPAPGETAPGLRFPAFQNAGEWEIQPLGGLLQCPPTYGANAAATPYDPNLPTYLRITDISEDGRFIHENKTSVNVRANAANSMQHGDIALTRTGASVGKAYLHTDANGPLVFAGFLIRVRPDIRLVLPEIIFQFLSTQNYWSWVEKTSTRSGQPGINSSEYASLDVPLPKDAHGRGMLEQQRIAAFLSSIDTLITALGDKIDALKAHKQGLMQQLFPVANEVQA